MYAAWYPDLTGTPWEDWQINALLEDRDAGCSLLSMKMRSRRSYEEVEAKLAELEKTHPPRIRRLGKSRSFGKR